MDELVLGTATLASTSFELDPIANAAKRDALLNLALQPYSDKVSTIVSYAFCEIVASGSVDTLRNIADYIHKNVPHFDITFAFKIRRAMSDVKSDLVSPLTLALSRKGMTQALGDVLKLFQVDKKDLEYILGNRYHIIENSLLNIKKHTALSYAMFSGEIRGMRDLGETIRSASTRTASGTERLLDPNTIKSLLQAADSHTETALSKVFEASSLSHRAEIIATFAELVRQSGLPDSAKAALISNRLAYRNDTLSSALLSSAVERNDTGAIYAYGKALVSLNLPEAMLEPLLSINNSHAIGAEIVGQQQGNRAPGVTAFLDVLGRLVPLETRYQILGITPPGPATVNPPPRRVLEDVGTVSQPGTKRRRFDDSGQAPEEGSSTSRKKPRPLDLNLEPEPDPAETDPDAASKQYVD